MKKVQLVYISWWFQEKNDFSCWKLNAPIDALPVSQLALDVWRIMYFGVGSQLGMWTTYIS
jgi:hypothetical protein